MKTFAVVYQSQVPPNYMFDGNQYLTLPCGSLVRDQGQGVAVTFICGAALEHRAKEESAKIQGSIVLTMETETWPSKAQIVDHFLGYPAI